MKKVERFICAAAVVIALSGLACTTGRSGGTMGGATGGTENTGGTMYNYTSSTRGTGTGGSHDGTTGYDTGSTMGNYTSTRGAGTGGTYELGTTESSTDSTMQNGSATGGVTAPSNDRMNGENSFEGYSGAATGKSPGGSTNGW